MQVNLLLLGNQKLSLVDQFIRWVLVDGTKSRGEDRFSIFGNREARKAAMGGVSKGKQNNLRVKVLLKNRINWDELSKRIEDFLIADGM